MIVNFKRGVHGNTFIQSVTRRFKKLFGDIMLRYRVKKLETQSDCHLLEVWINRIKRLVTVKKAITHKTNLENIYIFSQTPGGKSYDAAYVVAVALDRMIKHGSNVKETSLGFNFDSEDTSNVWKPGRTLMEYIKNVRGGKYEI